MRLPKLPTALLAFALIAAILASAALASTFVVEPEGEEEPYPAEILGSLPEGETEVIEFGEGAPPITCKTATLSGEELEADSELELAPEFAKCTTAGATTATITPNGCKYVMHTGAEIGNTGRYEGTTEVLCPAGKAIEVTWGGGCKAKTGSKSTGGTTVNQGLKTLEFENKTGSPADVIAKFAVTGIYYDATVVGKAGCMGVVAGEHTSLKVNGVMTLVGRVGSKSAPFDVDP